MCWGLVQTQQAFYIIFLMLAVFDDFGVVIIDNFSCSLFRKRSWKLKVIWHMMENIVTKTRVFDLMLANQISRLKSNAQKQTKQVLLDMVTILRELSTMVLMNGEETWSAIQWPCLVNTRILSKNSIFREKFKSFLSSSNNMVKVFDKLPRAFCSHFLFWLLSFRLIWQRWPRLGLIESEQLLDNRLITQLTESWLSSARLVYSRFTARHGTASQSW